MADASVGIDGSTAAGADTRATHPDPFSQCVQYVAGRGGCLRNNRAMMWHGVGRNHPQAGGARRAAPRWNGI